MEPPSFTRFTALKTRRRNKRLTRCMRAILKPALAFFDRQGAIQRAKGQEESRAALVLQWAEDPAAEPGKRRFIIAYTNREVDELNAAARAAKEERGLLGEDVSLQTKDGPQSFATGDQIILTANARSKAQKEAGLFNNSVGTITAIAEDERGHVLNRPA